MQVRYLDQKEGSTHPAFTGEGWCRGQGGWALYGAQVAGDMGWSSDPIIVRQMKDAITNHGFI